MQLLGLSPPHPRGGEGRDISFVEKHMKRRKGIKEVPGNVKAKGRKRINVKEIMKGNRGEKRYQKTSACGEKTPAYP